MTNRDYEGVRNEEPDEEEDLLSTCRPLPFRRQTKPIEPIYPADFFDLKEKRAPEVAPPDTIAKINAKLPGYWTAEETAIYCHYKRTGSLPPKATEPLEEDVNDAWAQYEEEKLLSNTEPEPEHEPRKTKEEPEVSVQAAERKQDAEAKVEQQPEPEVTWKAEPPEQPRRVVTARQY